MRHSIDRLCMSMGSTHLFAEPPLLHFYPNNRRCSCGATTTITKTSRKTIATLPVGEFTAVETQTACKACQQTYGSDELRSLTPHRGTFGFDVIEYIGQAVFVHCRSELQILAELATRNITISTREIGFLAKRFIVYLTLAHQACQAELKQFMQSKGGYILHRQMAPAKAIARTCSVAWMRSAISCLATGKCRPSTANTSCRSYNV